MRRSCTSERPVRPLRLIAFGSLVIFGVCSNFEYLSGEDPILGKVLVGPVIEGIQSQKVVANAKHWVR